MDRFKKTFVILVVISLSIFLTTTYAAAAEKVLKIGVIGPYTGASARVGDEIRAVTKLAFEDIGYKIGDYKVELVWIDSQDDPAKASNAYAEAVEKHGVQATIVQWRSSIAVALIDLAAKYKVPHYFSAGQTKIINEKYHSDPEKYGGYWFKLSPIPSKITQAYVDLMDSALSKGILSPDNRRVAIYGSDSDWGRGIGEGLREQFKQSGWQINTEDYFSYTETEFYSLLNKYKKANVAIIAGTNSGPASVAAFIKQADEIGLKSVIVGDAMSWVGNWYELTGKASDYVLDLPASLYSDIGKAWLSRVEKKHNIVPGGWVSLSYEGIRFFIKIAKRTYEKQGVINKEALHKTNLEEVVTGKLTFGVDDGAMMMKQLKYTSQTIPEPIFGVGYWYLPVVQYFDGKANVVWPEDVKTADFRIK